MLTLHASLIASLLLAAASSEPLLLPSQAEDGDSQLVARTFDLSAFGLAWPKGAFRDKRVQLLPLMRGISSPDGLVESDGRWEFDDDGAERLAEIFLMMNSMVELETVELTGDGMLYVEGPAEALAEFDRLQASLAAPLLSRPRLQISRFVAQGDLPELLRRGGVVPRAALDSLPMGALQGESHPNGSRSVSLPGGGIFVISDLESHTVTARVDCEVAEGAAALQASVREAAVGSELTLSGYRLADGLQLSYSVLQTERLDGPSRNNVACEWMLSSENGRIQADDSARWSENFGVTGGAVAGEAHLKADQVLLLTVGAAEGKTQVVVIGLDPASMGSSPVTTGLRSPLVESSWLIAPSGLLEPTSYRSAWNGPSRPRSLGINTFEAFDGGSVDVGILQMCYSHGEPSMLGRLLETMDIYDVMNFGGSVMLLHDQEREATAARFVQADAARARINLEVSVNGVDHAGTASELGSLTIQSGGEGALVCGNEVLVAKGLDTEIAQRSRIQMPHIVTHFEGLALTMELARTPGGQLAYRLQGQLSTDLSIGEGAANEVSGDGLLAIHSGHLVLDEQGLAEVDSDGTWKLVVGEPVGGASVTIHVRQK